MNMFFMNMPASATSALRRIVGGSLACLVSLCATLAANAQEVVCSSNTSESYVFRDSRENVRKSECVVKREDGTLVYDINVHTPDRSQYTVALDFPNETEVRKGDVMLARLTTRTLFAHQETQESAFYLMFQEASSPWTKSVNTQISCGPEWQTFNVPFVAGVDLPAGKASLELCFGSLAQHVQIKDVEVLDYGPDHDVDSLPKTAFTYPGREADSQWRSEALERIERIRTAPFDITVKNKDGKTLKGAVVRVSMRRSEFIWGTAVNERETAATDSVSDIYREKLKEFFNTGIVENGFKAGGWAWDAKLKANTLKAFQWLKDNGFRQRGHNLVWPAWKFNSPLTKLVAEQGDDERFDAYIKAQFHERIAYTKGDLIAWDVVNELMHEKEFFKHLPEDSVVDWFKLAKELDPSAQLFINEYGMLNGAQSPINIEQYIAKIEELVSKGAPVEAVGIQGHIGTLPRSPMQVISDLDLFIPLGLPVQITEFDINTEDEQLQADYTRDFLIAVYSHPLVTGVNLWGFWEGHHWKPAAAMFKKDWSEKPNAAVWRDLVLGEWRTDLTKPTDKRGKVSERGHFGEYEMEVTYKGETKTSRFTLTRSGYSCEVVF